MSKKELVNNMREITSRYNMGTLTRNEYIGQIRWEIDFYDLCTRDKERLETMSTQSQQLWVCPIIWVNGTQMTEEEIEFWNTDN